MSSPLGTDVIKQAPKVLLHDHLDGGLRPATVLDIAAQAGYDELPATDVDGLAHFFKTAAHSGSLVRYLEPFAHTVAVMQTPESLHRVALECVEDLAADHDVGGAGAGGFGGRHDARLVVGLGVPRADAGSHERDFGRQHGAQRGDFQGGTHETAKAGIGGEPAEADDLLLGRGRDAGLRETRGAHRREHGDAEQEKVRRVLPPGLVGPLHHLASAAGVQREHADREPGAGLDRLGDGVGDVVQLQVEEDLEAQAGDFANAVGAARGEHLEADLHPANGSLQLPERRSHVARGLGVEDED